MPFIEGLALAGSVFQRSAKFSPFVVLFATTQICLPSTKGFSIKCGIRRIVATSTSSSESNAKVLTLYS